MKVAIVHNEYGKFSGEEVVVESQVNLLHSNRPKVIMAQLAVEWSRLFSWEKKSETVNCIYKAAIANSVE